MARYASGPLRGQEIAWWPTSSQILTRPESLAADLVAECLTQYTSAGDLVLDPFCRSPAVVAQAVAAGRHALAVNVDPLAELLVRLALRGAAPQEVDSQLTRLADLPKVNATLREFVRNLYGTTCRTCGQEVSADCFLWDRDENALVRRRYRCPVCQTAQDDAVTEADVQQAKRVEAKGFEYYYVLDRLNLKDELDRTLAEQCLGLYTPRNLYALVQLLIKMEALPRDGADLRRAALLRAMDLGTKLHALPRGGMPYTPRRLSPPRQYLEINVWLAFEQACEELKRPPLVSPQRLVAAPDLLPVGNTATAALPAQAYVGRHAMRELAQRIPDASVALIITQPPLLDAVYWPLAHLWSGWLYGREVAGPLRGVARRRPGAWSWYARAMQPVVGTLRRLLRPDGHLVLSLHTNETAYQALLLAALDADLTLVSGEFCPDEPGALTLPFSGQPAAYHLVMARAGVTPAAPLSEAELDDWLCRQVRAAVHEAFERRGEPLTSPFLEACIWLHLARQPGFRHVLRAMPEGEPAYTRLRGHIVDIWQRARQDMVRWLTEDEKAQKGVWWLQSPSASLKAFDDQVETAVRELFARQSVWSPTALRAEVRQRFPPPWMPDLALLAYSVAAYARPLAGGEWAALPWDPDGWARTLADSLARLGTRLGYRVHLPAAEARIANVDVIWAHDGEAVSVFVLCPDAQVDALLDLPAPPDAARYLVIADERVPLLRYKIQRSLLRRQRLRERGWHFVKASRLAALAVAAEVDAHEWLQIRGLDPLVEQEEAQLPLF